MDIENAFHNTRCACSRKAILGMKRDLELKNIVGEIEEIEEFEPF